MKVFNGETENKGKWDIHLPDKKNKINNNYKCTVGIHGKTDELTKQKKKPQHKQQKQAKKKKKEKRNKETKHQHGANLFTVIQRNRPFPVAWGYGGHILVLNPESQRGGGGLNKWIKEQTFKIYIKPIKTADDVHTWLDG